MKEKLLNMSTKKSQKLRTHKNNRNSAMNTQELQRFDWRRRK